MQNQRIYLIDFTKGLAVFLLPFIHTLWIYGSLDLKSSSTYTRIIELIGQETPVFLICMGCSFVLTPKQKLKEGLKRGVIILFAAYFLNFMKLVLPSLLGIMPDNFLEAYGWEYPLNLTKYLYLLKTGDILHFAGISFLIISLIRAYIKNKWVILCMAFIIALSSGVLRGFNPEIKGTAYLFNLFFSDNYSVYFPIVPWFSFILIGLFMGMLYKESNLSFQHTLNKLMPLAISCLLIGVFLCRKDFPYHYNDFFHHGPGGNIYLIGLNLTLAWSVNYFIQFINKQTLFYTFFTYCSKRVTSLFIIQWVLICWGMSIFGYQSQGLKGILSLSFLFLGLTFAVQFLLDRTSKKKLN